MVSSACADSSDFQLSAGKLQLFPHTLRSNTVAFVHTLSGVNDVREEITEIPPIVVPAGAGGLWVVAWDIFGAAQIGSVSPGTVIGAHVFGALYRNDVLIVGTETEVVTNSQNNPTTAQPAYLHQTSGSGTEILNLVPGDQLSLYAARSADAGTLCQVISSAVGRTRMRAWRLGPS